MTIQRVATAAALSLISALPLSAAAAPSPSPTPRETPSPHRTDVPHESGTAAGGLSPKYIARLKAAGLSPDDKDLHAKLEALAKDRLSKHAGEAAQRVQSKPISETFQSHAAAVTHRVTLTPASTALLDTAHPSDATRGLARAVAAASTAPAATSAPAGPVLTGGLDWASPAKDYLDFEGTDLQSSDGSPTVFSILTTGIGGGRCTSRFSVPQSSAASPVRISPRPVLPGAIETQAFVFTPSVKVQSATALVQGKTTTLSPSAGSIIFSFAEPLQGWSLDPSATVTAKTDGTASLAADPALGLSAGAPNQNAFLGSASRYSTDPLAASGGSGTDVLGRGVSLLNGWTATAAITSVSSYMDAQPDGNDEFRSATIAEQPAAGRLETKVNWTFAPGESVSYTIVWTLRSSGSAGYRPLSSLPKTGACMDEN
jgi:hypothetical protein